MPIRYFAAAVRTWVCGPAPPDTGHKAAFGPVRSGKSALVPAVSTPPACHEAIFAPTAGGMTSVFDPAGALPLPAGGASRPLPGTPGARPSGPVRAVRR